MSNLNDQIVKYLKGELSPTEMHALEKKALSDPFLADALEGGEMVDPIEFDKAVKEIEKRTHHKKNARVLWPLRIAASILLIVAVTYLVTTTTSTVNEKKSLALNDTPKATEESTENQPAQAEESLAQEEEQQQQSQQPVTSVKPTPRITENEITQQQIPVETNSSDESAGAGAALSGESLIAEQNTTALKVDEEDTFSLSDDRDIAEKDMTRARKEAGKADVAPASEARTETLKSKKQAFETPEKAPSPSVSDEEYLDYIKKNLVYPQQAIGNRTQGEVTLSFTIDSEGTPVDFRIEKSIGFGCDEELIRLVTKGPKWTTLENQRAYFSFTFTLPE